MTCKKEIRICYATSHVFAHLVSTLSLVLIGLLFYLVAGWSELPWPLPKPSPGTPPPASRSGSPPAQPAEKYDTNVFRLTVGAPHLQVCWLAVISPILQVFPLVKEKINNSFGFVFNACVPQASRRRRFR